VARVRWNTRGAIRIANRSMREGCWEIMREVLRESINEAPKDTGYLRSTAEMYETATSIVIRYTAPYAAEQHENLFYRHKIGKAKYLEDPYNRIVPRAIKRRLGPKVRQDLRNSR